MGLYLKDAWWNDLGELRTRTGAIYERLNRDIWQVTAEKMIELRGWKVSEAQLIPVLQEHDIYYVPKKLIPGPMFVFPQVDVAGNTTRAQTKPLHDLFGQGKYHTIGLKRENFLGPVWLGNSTKMLEKILQHKTLAMVEGPFDFVAARVANPETPVLCPLTKSLGDKHADYLKILGVKQIYLLFDNDGPGMKSMEVLQREFPIPCVPLVCPTEDPSECLRSVQLRKSLTKVLDSVE